jgi:hypothetical protein
MKELSFARDESEYLMKESRQKHEEIKVFNEQIAVMNKLL